MVAVVVVESSMSSSTASDRAPRVVGDRADVLGAQRRVDLQPEPGHLDAQRGIQAAAAKASSARRYSPTSAVDLVPATSCSPRTSTVAVRPDA